MIGRIICLLYFIGFSSLSAENKYTIEPQVRYQNIDNFGASDAWTFQFLGTNYPEEVQKDVATLFFSQKFDSYGTPKGIGLSLWRFNIGAGSRENPNNCIDNYWRTTDCFLDSTGRYDFKNKQKGQTSFLKRAKEEGCDQFLGFCNSPPWFMTRNRQGSNLGGADSIMNLPEENYDQFAKFLVNVYKGLKRNHGITLNYLSPINEPEWDWKTTNQEGTPASVPEIHNLFKVLSRSFKKERIGIELMATESGQYDFMYSPVDRSWIGNQIQKLYSKDSKYYIGDLYGVSNTIAGHSYWTGHREKLIPTRESLRQMADKHNLNVWQSEVCIMSNDGEIGGGGGRDMSMRTALYIARMIHYDLTVANVSAWQWWTAVSPEDYKDGLLFVDKNIEGTPNLYIPKLLWAFGNYSRFIRPGATRIGVTGEMDMDGLLLSSYENIDKSIVSVIINSSETPISISLKVPMFVSHKLYVTSDDIDENLKFEAEISSLDDITIKSKSIVTIVSK
ncbi:MAG: glycoside hydrolase [Bacteroidales bacterium]